MFRNLSHFQNSCAVNASFVMLSYLGCESNDDLISDMLAYVKNKPHHYKISSDSNVLIRKFYVDYKLTNEFKSCYEIIKLIKDKLIFTHGTLLYEDIAADLKLKNTEIVNNLFNNALVAVDFQQILSMLDYYDDRSLKVEMSTKRGLISELMFVKDNSLNSLKKSLNSELASLKQVVHYLPCLYVVCDNNHYKVYVNTKTGVKVYDDLKKQVSILDRVVIDVLNRDKINNVEYVIYIRQRVTN